jgi:Ni,Fe-hydrogenase III large subunit
MEDFVGDGDALEAAAGTEIDEATALGRVGALERERAAGHLGWLAGFGSLIGFPWLARRAEKLQLAALRAGTGDGESLRAEVRQLARRAERTPLLRRKLAGIALLPDPADATGPVARAAGQKTDARSEEEPYCSLGFEPVVEDGSDALARLRVRLAEIEQSLDLLRKVGGMSEAGSPARNGISGSGKATLETPRGAATLRVTVEEGEVTSVELNTPSSRHLELVEGVTDQREVSDALVGVGSLDLSPWEVVG